MPLAKRVVQVYNDFAIPGAPFSNLRRHYIADGIKDNIRIADRIFIRPGLDGYCAGTFFYLFQHFSTAVTKENLVPFFCPVSLIVLPILPLPTIPIFLIWFADLVFKILLMFIEVYVVYELLLFQAFSV